MDKKGIYTVLIIFGGLFFLFTIFVLLVFAVLHGKDFSRSDNQIGVVEIKGTITDSREINEDIKAFVEDDNIKAILVRIDSPGGSVAPSQEIYSMLVKASKKKKVVVSMGSVAASGGYYIALGADRIFANPGSVTGSIGVIATIPQIDQLLAHIKIRVDTIQSGTYKDSGSPFRPMNDMDRQLFQSVIDDIYEEFIRVVSEERQLEIDEVRQLADGRVFTGRQAKELNLIDQVGSMDDAVDWLAEELGMEGEPELIYPPEDPNDLFGEFLSSALQEVYGESRAVSTPVIEYRYVGY